MKGKKPSTVKPVPTDRWGAVGGRGIAVAAVVAIALSVLWTYDVMGPRLNGHHGTRVHRVDDWYGTTNDIINACCVHDFVRVIYEIDDFFHPALVARWRDGLMRRWHNQSWWYASNDAGTNNKAVSQADVVARRAHAHERAARGVFAYAKYELLRNDSLAVDMRRYMETPAIQAHIAKLTNITQPLSNTLADFFVTFYAKGDFLSEHNVCNPNVKSLLLLV
jgi:hypothetical protein